MNKTGVLPAFVLKAPLPLQMHSVTFNPWIGRGGLPCVMNDAVAFVVTALSHLMHTENSPPLLAFFGCAGTDHRGRTLSQILQKSDRWLEETHDYIQWLFPLDVESQFNPHAPLITDDVCAAFTNPASADRRTLQQNFGLAIRRMLAFYGYSFSPGFADVSPTSEWTDKAENWLTDGNHNFMRMTRMLRSMTLLGRRELAHSFHKCLVAAARVHPTIITGRVLGFWEAAVEDKATDR